MRKREREREQLLADLIPNQSPRKVVGGTYYTQVYVSGKETRKRARILDKSGLIGLIFPSLVRRILLKDRRIIETFDPIIISLLSPFDLIPRTIRSIVASFSIGLSNCSNFRGKSFSTAKRTRWGIDNSNSGKLSAAFARLFFPAYCAWHNKNCIRFFRTKLFPRILHKMKIANWITTRFDTGSPCFTRNRHLIIDFSGEDRTQARRKGNWKEGRIKYASRHQSNNRAHRTGDSSPLVSKISTPRRVTKRVTPRFGNVRARLLIARGFKFRESLAAARTIVAPRYPHQPCLLA